MTYYVVGGVAEGRLFGASVWFYPLQLEITHVYCAWMHTYVVTTTTTTAPVITETITTRHLASFSEMVMTAPYV